MSKKLILKDGSGLDPSKKFTFENFNPGENEALAFQPEWPKMQAKKYSSQFDHHLKELEARVLRKTKERALILEKEAYEKGFAQGEKNGLELQQKKMETIAHHLDLLLQEMERQRTEIYKTYEKEIVQLALSIVKKILQHELTLHEDVIRFTFQEAYKQVVDRRKVIIHLNPTDCQYLLAHGSDLPVLRGEENGVKILEDPAITRGGCLLETAYGEVNATIENQYDQIASLVWQKITTDRLQSTNASGGFHDPLGPSH